MTAAVLLLCVSHAAAQEGAPAGPIQPPPEKAKSSATASGGRLATYPPTYPIDPRIPPPPPPADPLDALTSGEEYPLPELVQAGVLAELVPPPLPQPLFDVPLTVTLYAGTHVDVLLETPMSTRISKVGQRVEFRTTHPIRVTPDLSVPPGVVFSGVVTTMKKPGGFGRGGDIRVTLDKMELPNGASARIVARLTSADAAGYGNPGADRHRVANILDLSQWALTGTVIGARAGGGVGAGVGAGAGALVALIIMASRKGQDIYLEPGMPFVVALDRAAELPGSEVYAAQENYYRAMRQASSRSAADADSGVTASGNASDPYANGIPDSERPRLKKRPKP